MPRPVSRPSRWPATLRIRAILWMAMSAYAIHQMPAHAGNPDSQGHQRGEAVASRKVESKKSEGKPRVGSVRFIRSSSEETKAQRTKRLKRECKGRPNAGACLGMTD
ncbi:hypothetical protein [Hydrogenophaga sp. 5NK40-0174]|uniref:hypothetical protein n=1 Tax=Hydrogenophaga sp. 5NK40-0174 TaxID=3127649 RepID=UPI0031066842